MILKIREIPEYRNPEKLDRTRIPEPIFDEQPGFVELYWTAWQQAWDHVVERPQVKTSPYIDEGCSRDTIWIWDTCFMSFFCRYAYDIFPGIESLENIYAPLCAGFGSSLTIHHPDNPPLFAWAETEYFSFTADIERFAMLKRTRYLEKNFRSLDKSWRGLKLPFCNNPKILHRTPMGFLWSGCQSGMDNTPRGNDDYESILWVDIMGQLALAADCLLKIYELTGDKRNEPRISERRGQCVELLNRHYWDEEDGFYYDIASSPPHDRVKVKTPASYWPMLAGVCNAEQAERMRDRAMDPDVFGGDIPWPSVARNDNRYFDPKGAYWRGGVWLPTAYAGIKSLQRYSFLNDAHTSALALLRHMYRTYVEFEPHTIWEAYSPTAPLPSTGKSHDTYVRPDFCGWSALGPISLFIENVLGFHGIDALARRVEWNRVLESRHGIRRLRFGDITADLLWENGKALVDTDQPFTLVLNDEEFHLTPGHHELTPGSAEAHEIPDAVKPQPK